MNANDEVLFSEMPGENGDLGVITLNRPNVLNSLNLNMIHLIHRKLEKWAVTNHIKAVVIRAAEGRAFCAGGDLRLTYDRHLAHHTGMADFFRDEYQLNRFIFHFPKPYIALLDGITMGGGVGISIHGSHRVATERLLFAMPETGIGFFPDVGGTYFLPRLPHHLGFYLGLSGARLTSDDCVAIGIAQHKVSKESLPLLMTTLAQQPLTGDARSKVSEVLQQFHQPMAKTPFIEQKTELGTHFSAKKIEDILQNLQQSASPLCKETAKILYSKSPTSLKVTMRALQMGQQLNFDDCMRQEYRLVNHFLKGHDFFEGIRAVIIDKDQAPKWNPSSLEGVTQSEVEKYFEPLSQELMQ